MDELVDSLVKSGVLESSYIKEALQVVDRANFVPEQYQEDAYRDTALSIGYGQTISQPYTVVFMLELLGVQTGEKILDVGSGSGWTTALLAHLTGKQGNVFGVELVPELVEMGKRNLKKYNFKNASIQQAGKVLGLSKEAPFDRILVSAASGGVPNELVAELARGGTMVLPVGNAIWRIEKRSDGDLDIQKYEGFRFVPLIQP